MHEASMHNNNAFITLTYSDENIPYGGTLVKPHFQKFMKRFRRQIEPNRVRFYMCGEYGDQFMRPHYHALLFGYDFKDKELFATDQGVHSYTSDFLESVWGLGHCTTGQVTWQSAAYVARYVIKKQTGKNANEHYETLVPETGELIQREPEYTTMSLRPAIGKSWFETYKRDCYPSDFVTHRGKKLRVPKYYDTQIPDDELAELKEKRKQKAWQWDHEQTQARLKARETCTLARVNKLERKLA